MLDFSPTEEQEEVRRLAQSIALEHLRLEGRNAEKSGTISSELMQTLAQTGLTTPFSEAYGGSGDLEAMTYVLIAEELSFGDGGLATNVIGSLLGALTVTLAGNEEQRIQYVAPFCDERTGYTLRSSLAFAERSGGRRLAAIQLTARPEGDAYVLNGTKRDVVYGNDPAHLRVVFGRLPDTTGSAGLCAFILPAQLDGLQISAEQDKLGLIAAPSASYTFDNARVPANSLLGEPGNNGLLCSVALYHILRAAIACGTARAALAYASDYAKERTAFGRPIVSYQGIAFMIAEMAMKLDAARLLLWQAATSWDRHIADETLLQLAQSAHRQALTIAQSSTIDAVQIMGGAGYIQDHPVEMWMRNAAAME